MASDLFNLYVQAGSPNGDDQPNSAIRWAADEIISLRQKLEAAPQTDTVAVERDEVYRKAGEMLIKSGSWFRHNHDEPERSATLGLGLPYDANLASEGSRFDAVSTLLDQESKR